MDCHLEQRKGTFDEWVALAISSVLFVGFLPGKLLGRSGKYGGLAGSLVALLIQFLFFGYNYAMIMLAGVFVTFIVGMSSVVQAEVFMLERWGPGQRHTGEEAQHDFNQTCIDEFHGQLLAGLPLWLIPGLEKWPRVVMLLVAFVLFRFFDAKKVWLVRTVEQKLDGLALGIMLDDTVAGFFAAVLIAAAAVLIYV